MNINSPTLLKESIKNLRRGWTTLIVVHRLSTFRDAGKLVVLKDGSAVEAGTHAQLIEKAGYYSEFVSSQVAASG